MQARMRRRTLLGFAIVAAVVPASIGCTPDADPGPDPAPTTDGPTDDSTASADAALRAAAAAAENELIALYEATITAHAGLAASLAPLAEQHREHRAALEAGIAPATGNPPNVPTVSADPGTAVAEIITAERRAADARTVDCEQAGAEDLARLLALIAASEASHSEALSTTGPSS